MAVGVISVPASPSPGIIGSRSKLHCREVARAVSTVGWERICSLLLQSLKLHHLLVDGLAPFEGLTSMSGRPSVIYDTMPATAFFTQRIVAKTSGGVASQE